MAQLSYDALQREVSKRILTYTFVRGQGGPLALVWALGFGLFVFLWPTFEYAALWSVACAAIAGLMIRDYLRSQKARGAVSKDILEARFPIDHISDTRHRDAIRQGIELFLELLAKLDETKRTRGLDEEMADSVSEMDRLLSLQLESAKQVEELDRILRLVSAEQRLGAMGTLGLHRENTAAIQNEIAEADGLVELIGQQMETLLLQVYRYEAGATDLLARVESRQHSAEALDRIQQNVDARRYAAKQLIELVVPDWHGETDPVDEIDPVDQDVSLPSTVKTGNGSSAVKTGNGSSNKALDIRDLTSHKTNGSTNGASFNGVIDQQDDEEWTRLVAEALRNLHNPDALASSELIIRLPHTLSAARNELGYAPSQQPTPLEQRNALAQLLATTIEGLKPAEGSTADGLTSSLQYSILVEEYLQARSTTAVMVRHGIGESTLHRHRKRAVSIVARELRAQEHRLAGAPAGVD